MMGRGKKPRANLVSAVSWLKCHIQGPVLAGWSYLASDVRPYRCARGGGGWAESARLGPPLRPKRAKGHSQRVFLNVPMLSLSGALWDVLVTDGLRTRSPGTEIGKATKGKHSWAFGSKHSRGETHKEFSVCEAGSFEHSWPFSGATFSRAAIGNLLSDVSQSHH